MQSLARLFLEAPAEDCRNRRRCGRRVAAAGSRLVGAVAPPPPKKKKKTHNFFLHGAWDNGTVRAMFDASLGLAKQLDMEVVAEGVEDRDDWDFLRKTECDIAQGYFIAKPMRAASLPDWINSWQMRLQKELATAPQVMGIR